MSTSNIPPELSKEVTQKLGEIAHISNDQKTLKTYATDASIFEVTPSLIIFPKNTEELKGLVCEIVAQNELGNSISISPRAAGTCMSGGSLTQGVMIDMKMGFNFVEPVNVKERSVWAGAGTYYRDVEKETMVHNLLFAAYPSSKQLCAVGGMIGNNCSGEKSMRYGATVDNVFAIKMVCIDGNEYEFSEINESELDEKKKLPTFEGKLYRDLARMIEENTHTISRAKPHVRKNVAGYGLWNVWNSEKKTFNIAKLIIGSQGTLGIVTKVKLKLIEAPTYARMIVLYIDSLTRLAEGVKIMRSHNPEGMETFDINTFNYAKKFIPEFASQTPKAEGKPIILFGQFVETTQEATDAAAESCVQELQSKNFDVEYVTELAEQKAYWEIRRHGYSLLRDHAEKSRAVPFIEDTIVPIEHFSEFVTGFESILDEYKVTYGFHGHIGDGSIRMFPMIDMEESEAPDLVFDIAKKTYELVLAFGGSISADHNDGLIRTPFLKLMYEEEMITLFERIKVLFDPHLIFNPGKKVGGSLAYSKEHMSRKNNP